MQAEAYIEFEKFAYQSNEFDCEEHDIAYEIDQENVCLETGEDDSPFDIYEANRK